MKKFYLLTLVTLSAIFFACDNNKTPNEPIDPTPTVAAPSIEKTWLFENDGALFCYSINAVAKDSLVFGSGGSLAAMLGCDYYYTNDLVWAIKSIEKTDDFSGKIITTDEKPLLYSELTDSTVTLQYQGAAVVSKCKAAKGDEQFLNLSGLGF